MRRLVMPLVILAAAVCISQEPAEAPTTAPQSATAPVRTEFRVKFISGANVYIDGGRSAGLTEGTKLILKQNPTKPAGDPSNIALQPGIVAKLTVVSVASTSADPASIPKELQTIVPRVRVPIRMIIAEGQTDRSLGPLELAFSGSVML